MSAASVALLKLAWPEMLGKFLKYHTLILCIKNPLVVFNLCRGFLCTGFWVFFLYWWYLKGEKWFECEESDWDSGDPCPPPPHCYSFLIWFVSKSFTSLCISFPVHVKEILLLLHNNSLITLILFPVFTSIVPLEYRLCASTITGRRNPVIIGAL